MNTRSLSRSTSAQQSLQHGRSIPMWAGVIAALLLLAKVEAQQLMPPAPEQPLVAPIMRPATPDTSPSATSFQSFPTGEISSAGEFKLRPHLSTSYFRADGLQGPTGGRVSSDLYTFSPGLAVDFGSHWTSDYTANWVWYDSDALNDSVSQNFRLVGANKAPDLDLEVNENYSNSTTFLIQTGKQTQQTTWATGLSATHTFGNLLRYLGSVGMTKTNTEGFANTRAWVTDHWFRGAISPKVNAGAGLGLGYTEIPNAPNTRYESFKGNLGWKASDKIELSLNAGWEHWHVLSTVEKDKWYPVLDGSLSWLPFENTKIALTDSRSVSVAIDGAAVTSSHTWGISLGQKLFGKLLLNLAYNHAASEYDAKFGTRYEGRSDDIKAFRSSLALQIYRRWLLSATYQKSKNYSTVGAYNYDASQYGLQLSANF